MDPKVRGHVRNSPPLVPNINEIGPVHITPSIFKTHCDTVLLSTPWPLQFRFPN